MHMHTHTHAAMVEPAAGAGAVTAAAAVAAVGTSVGGLGVSEVELDLAIDQVFENALAQRPPVLFGPPSLDSLYERDLSGLTIPVTLGS